MRCAGARLKKHMGRYDRKNIGNKLKGEAVMKKLVEIWQGQRVGKTE